MWLESESSDDEIDTDDNNSKECDREDCIVFINGDNVFCGFWETDNDHSLHEWEPADESDKTSPIERPYIVYEDARDTQREWCISCDEYDTWFTYYWLHISDYDLSSYEEENPEDDKRKPPKLCQKYCSVHRKK